MRHILAFWQPIKIQQTGWWCDRFYHVTQRMGKKAKGAETTSPNPPPTANSLKCQQVWWRLKWFLGLRMLVFNDINKTRRKFHLHSVICSVPQVAPVPSDREEWFECERRESGERKFKVPLIPLNKKVVSKHVSQSVLFKLRVKLSCTFHKIQVRKRKVRNLGSPHC